MDMSGIDRRSDGKFSDMTDGASLGVDNRGPHEGGDARSMIGVLGHSIRSVLYPLYLLPRMLAQLSADRSDDGRLCQSRVTVAEKNRRWRKDHPETLTFEESTSTLPSQPLSEADDGIQVRQGHLWPIQQQAVSALP